jgi:hypothetical protein
LAYRDKGDELTLGPCGCVRGVAAMRHSNLSRGRAVMWADSESLRRIRHVSLADILHSGRLSSSVRRIRHQDCLARLTPTDTPPGYATMVKSVSGECHGSRDLRTDNGGLNLCGKVELAW